MDKTQVQALKARRKFLSMAVFTFIVVGITPRAIEARGEEIG
jgi:hypothetical protein